MGILKNWELALKPENGVAIIILAVVLVVSIGSPAYAQDLSPITTMLQTIGTALTGPVGRAFGLLAIVACGFLFMTGRMSWQFAGSVFIGLVLVFGSAAILEGFADS